MPRDANRFDKLSLNLAYGAEFHFYFLFDGKLVIIGRQATSCCGNVVRNGAAETHQHHAGWAIRDVDAAMTRYYLPVDE